MNEKLGLPYGEMKKVTICFDVDGTLLSNEANSKTYENTRILEMLRTLATFKNVRIVVWSGGGKQYAQRWVTLFGLEDLVWRVASKTEYKDIQPDIAIDDVQDTNLGKINLIVREK